MPFVEEKMHYSESPSDLQENWKYQMFFYNLNFPIRKSQKFLFSGLRSFRAYASLKHENRNVWRKKTTFNICIYWEEDSSALEKQKSLCLLSVFHLTLFFLHLNIFLSDVSSINILGYNYIMCANKTWFRHSLSPGWLCPEQDRAVSGLQQQIQRIGKRRKEDIPRKELLSWFRHPLCAYMGRQSLGGRELTLIYRAL